MKRRPTLTVAETRNTTDYAYLRQRCFDEGTSRLSAHGDDPRRYPVRSLRVHAGEHNHNPEWSDDKNKAVFGLCNNPNYHGHNYELIVRLTGEPDPETGFVYDMKKLSDLIRDNISLRFDHKNLNLDTVEFKDLNPTAENIAIVVYDILRRKIDSKFDLKITLYETERNFVEYYGN